MTQRKKAMRIIDGVLIGFTMMLVLAVGGLPLEWMLDLLSMTSFVIEGFTLAALSVAVWLIHAIADAE
jgi:hypothetical protein